MRTTRTAGLDARTVEAPAGVLDRASAGELSRLLETGHRPGTTVVLDLRGVTALDSSALGAVLAAERRLTADGGALQLLHARRAVLRVLRISGLAGRLVPPLVVVPIGATAG